ncbi:mannonate dehydratase [Reticulomyxa filosa]|uniref:mannonate dehydratase n=1 Tax=Reticulomyxa filosa TaxID=46433 RepID=X6MG75_RETFI|nr:mannonate dehydratase [Reticulomyxa filosa]|eukprot:ETO12864.1 mannonate dehydratase [Reticulomyxa filosa]
MRWFGPNDPVTLDEIRQTGCKGIVTALHDIPVGDIWSKKAIMERKKEIEKNALRWLVVESVPVHESIKLRKKDNKASVDECNQLIENYATSLKNLSECGVHYVAFHFMPLLDWTRTQLEYKCEDNTYALAFDYIDLCVFEQFILQFDEKELLKRYSKEEISAAKQRFEHEMTPKQVEQLKNAIISGMPGCVNSKYDSSVDMFKKQLSLYVDVSKQQLRDNLLYFLGQIVPVCEKYHVNLALHPDDPPFDILGIPRIVSTAQDLDFILSLFYSVKSKRNGITLCVGSYASREDNNVVEITRKFKDRVNFVHLRNVAKHPSQRRTFVESNHLSGDVDMFEVMNILLHEMKHRAESKTDDRLDVCLRPDHGHIMLHDFYMKNVLKVAINPGYTLYGRFKGLCELRGLQMALQRVLKFKTHQDIMQCKL